MHTQTWFMWRWDRMRRNAQNAQRERTSTFQLAKAWPLGVLWVLDIYNKAGVLYCGLSCFLAPTNCSLSQPAPFPTQSSVPFFFRIRFCCWVRQFLYPGALLGLSFLLPAHPRTPSAEQDQAAAPPLPAPQGSSNCILESFSSSLRLEEVRQRCGAGDPRKPDWITLPAQILSELLTSAAHAWIISTKPIG